MSTLKAVVFDDDDLFCYLYTRIFLKKDIQVTTYSSPESYICSQPGVEACPVETPCTDFLLTDLRMTDMTGLEFLMRIKQLGCKIPECRKAIVSGDWTDEDKNKAKQLVRNVFDKSESHEDIARWIEESSE